MTFSGFPSRARATAIPDVFFTDVLPQLSSREDLVVALCALRALQAKRGYPRYITADDVRAESAAGALAAVPDGLRRGDGPGSAIERGLARAVEIGVLLPLAVERAGEQVELFFLNAPADRRGLDAVRSGAVDIGATPRPAAVAERERSNIFALYESLVGTMSPLIADELADAERLYPAEWLEAAFREAASQNARSWRYVTRILERWAIEGPDHATIERRAAGDDDRYFRGKYGRILKQRLQP